MQVLLYEWCCSGGLAGCGSADAFAAIGAEGRAMLEALASDAARDPGLDVHVLIDPRLPLSLPGRAQRREVPPGHDLPQLVSAALAADWTIIVAPETDGILLERVTAVRAAGGRVLGATMPFIAIASDKQATANALAAVGVPVPAGRLLAPGEPVPHGFALPAVRKPRDGVGGDGFTVLHRPDIAPAPRAARLEAFVAGEPVGVSCLCGPGGIHVLPPMRQRFTATEPPRYLGGEPLGAGPLSERAGGLATRAIAAVRRAAGSGADLGWVGVDMILGARDDGRADRVLEVNPRLTTSFVGLGASATRSLVRTMIDLAEGLWVSDGAA